MIDKDSNVILLPFEATQRGNVGQMIGNDSYVKQPPSGAT